MTADPIRVPAAKPEVAIPAAKPIFRSKYCTTITAFDIQSMPIPVPEI